MEKHIQAMVDHWLKIFICVLFVTNTQVYGLDEIKVNITFIEDAVAKGAVCLDGSPGAYHYDKGSGEGVNNWLVYLPGGAWCGSKEDCLKRKAKPLGSNKNIKKGTFGAVLSPNQTINPDFFNWNRAVIRYCDGASFMADVEAVDPETNLHLRGGRIFRTAVEELLAKGLANATKAILMGNSAGGLATFLNCDRFRAFLPRTTTVKCVADSGFFIHGKNLPGVKERERFYANVTAFHELAKVLPTSCTSRMDPSLCLFPENVIEDIQTPVFVLNTAYDKYQIQELLKPRLGDESGWHDCAFSMKCTTAQFQTIKDFRTTFLETLKQVRDNPSRGMFINSCFLHDFVYTKGNWQGIPTLESKTIANAIGDWYFDRNPARLIDTQHDIPLNCTVELNRPNI